MRDLTSSSLSLLPSLGACTLLKARRRSAGGPLALGLPLKMTVSPERTLLTTALFCTMVERSKTDGRSQDARGEEFADGSILLCTRNFQTQSKSATSRPTIGYCTLVLKM